MTRQEFIRDCLSLTESLYKVAFYILEDSKDAEDAVQDLFLKLWTSETDFTVDNPKAYCIAMMKNLCIDRLRRAKKEYGEPLSENLSYNDDIVRNIESKETLERISRAMEGLSESQRNVLKMKVFDDLTYEEISRRTAMNTFTLRVLLSQARRKLKNAL